jgi:hypothetical protein
MTKAAQLTVHILMIFAQWQSGGLTCACCSYILALGAGHEEQICRWRESVDPQSICMRGRKPEIVALHVEWRMAHRTSTSDIGQAAASALIG